MAKQIKNVIEAEGYEITVYTMAPQTDYISLTDIAKYGSYDPAKAEPSAIIQNWMRAKDTIEFLGLWEKLHNPHFKPLEFEGFWNAAGKNGFTLSPTRWIQDTAAIGMQTKAGKGGGTFGHSDIAFEFASWISPAFKLYLIKDYQRLKQADGYRNQLEWNARRDLAKVNYRIHTDAIQTQLVPKVTPAQVSFTYAAEADLLNVALFGLTAKQWRLNNPALKGNLRDHASIAQLLVLANLESLNDELIYQGLPQGQRLGRLNRMAIRQMDILAGGGEAAGSGGLAHS